MFGCVLSDSLSSILCFAFTFVVQFSLYYFLHKSAAFCKGWPIVLFLSAVSQKWVSQHWRWVIQNASNGGCRILFSIFNARSKRMRTKDKFQSNGLFSFFHSSSNSQEGPSFRIVEGGRQSSSEYNEHFRPKDSTARLLGGVGVGRGGIGGESESRRRD